MRVTDRMEESPGLLTDQLDENDSALFLSLLPLFRLGYSLNVRLRTKEVGQRWREGRVARGQGFLEIENRENN
jgi:hypothetical protein